MVGGFIEDADNRAGAIMFHVVLHAAAETTEELGEKPPSQESTLRVKGGSVVN